MIYFTIVSVFKIKSEYFFPNSGGLADNRNWTKTWRIDKINKRKEFPKIQNCMPKRKYLGWQKRQFWLCWRVYEREKREVKLKHYRQKEPLNTKQIHDGTRSKVTVFHLTWIIMLIQTWLILLLSLYPTWKISIIPTPWTMGCRTGRAGTVLAISSSQVWQ